MTDANGAATYTYDDANRLTEESKVDDLLSAVDYVYDEANRLASVDGVPYTWNANRNLLSDGAKTYTGVHPEQNEGIPPTA